VARKLIQREENPNPGGAPAPGGAPPEGGGAPAPAGGLQPGAKVPVKIKLAPKDVDIPGTPLKLAFEVGSEAEFTVSKAKEGGGEGGEGGGTPVTAGPGLEIGTDGIHTFAQTEAEHECSTWGVSYKSGAGVKKSSEGVEIELSVEKEGKLLVPCTYKISTGAVVGKSTEIKLVGAEVSFPWPGDHGKEVKVAGLTGKLEWKAITAGTALKADAISLIKWLIEVGGMDLADGAAPILMDSAGMIGAIALFAYATTEAFIEIEKLDEPITNMARDAAFASRGYSHWVTGNGGEPPRSKADHEVFNRAQQDRDRLASLFKVSPEDVQRALRNSPDKLQPIAKSAMISAKNEAYQRAARMVDDYWAKQNWFEKTFAIKDKAWYHDNANTLVERQFDMILGF
jgi:hypothetical protein